MMATSLNLSKNVSQHDSLELDRLAEELASREAHGRDSVKQLSNSESPELPPQDLPELLPLSHDNPHLSSADFSIEEFLLSRSYTSLPDLRSELRDYLGGLKEELVRLINDDYEAFISLSTDLKGEGARLERLIYPLDGLRQEISISKSEFSSIQGAISNRLERRAKLREEQALLQLLLKISESITRIESLLSIPPPEQDSLESSSSTEYRPSQSFTSESEQSEDHASSRNSAKHLQRVATEYTQLVYQIEKAQSQGCLFVSEIQWRVERLKSTLSADLEYFLSSTLKSLSKTYNRAKGNIPGEKGKSMSDLKALFSAYDMLHLWRDAEDVVRRDIVREFVKKTIFLDALSAPHSPILPRTPFPHTTRNFLTSQDPPRTPYTPFSAFASKQNPFFAEQSFINEASDNYMLDDADNALASLYNKVLRFVDRNMQQIMACADHVGAKNAAVSTVELSDSITPPLKPVDEREEEGFELMANVVWDEIGRAIMDDLGNIVFAVGRPDDFRKRYETTQAFLRSLEYLAPSSRAVKHMRSHPTYTTLDRRWQLPVYFQLRWKDIVSKLEESLSTTAIDLNKSTFPDNANETETFRTKQAYAVWEAIATSWSGEVYIPDLSYRFWRLTHQFLSRYKAWLNDSLPALEPATRLIVPSGSDKLSTTPSVLSRSSTPVSQQDNITADRAGSDDTLLKQCAAVIQDIRALNSRVWSLWREEISILLPDMKDVEDGIAGAEDALNSSLAPLMDLLPPMCSQIISILSRRACDALTPVKSLPGQFRATSNKHMPTNPSQYVSMILRPVKTFFAVEAAGGQGKLLKDAYMSEMSTFVFDAVICRYIAHLTAMRKTEESLRRLKKGKKSGFSLFGTSSTTHDDDVHDEERVRTQLVLDVNALGKDAELLGVDIYNNDMYKTLNHLVHTSSSDGDVS